MQDVNVMMENIKAGNYNNYVGNNGSQAGHNASVLSIGSHERTNSPPTKDDID
jgi:hypothetical protein